VATRRRPAAAHNQQQPLPADAGGVSEPCDQEGDPMNNTSHPAPWRLRFTAAGLALAGLFGAMPALAATAQASQSAHPAAAVGAMTPQTIHLVAHEKQRKVLNQGGFGDEEIFRGILDNASGATQVGIFAGTLTSVSSNDSLNLATVDLQLPGGQITVQGSSSEPSPASCTRSPGGPAATAAHAANSPSPAHPQASST
jgi:uncharacterized protein (DUF1501 family)